MVMIPVTVVLSHPPRQSLLSQNEIMLDTHIDELDVTNEPRRHPDLWFPDGSVILRTEDALFRVHISLLSRHSTFFRDMFSLPQPDEEMPSSSSQEYSINSHYTPRVYPSQMDGCPVVHMYDIGDDVAALLFALYDGPKFGNNDVEDFRVVSGILRLSTKYFIDTLRAKAIAHLSSAWPSTLKGWDIREDIARAYDLEGTRRHYPSPIAVINLAREVDAPSLLASAFYDLSRYSFSQIFEPNEDGEYLLRPPSSSVPSTLTPSDMEKLALGKEASQHAITALIQSMGSSPYHLLPAYSPPHAPAHHHSLSAPPFRKSFSRTCVSAAACRKDFSELIDLATQHYLFDRERGCLDPLYVAEELGQLKSVEFCECKACAKALESWAARERERLWKMIPIWFRLESV